MPDPTLTMEESPFTEYDFDQVTGRPAESGERVDIIERQGIAGAQAIRLGAFGVEFDLVLLRYHDLANGAAIKTQVDEYHAMRSKPMTLVLRDGSTWPNILILSEGLEVEWAACASGTGLIESDPNWRFKINVSCKNMALP